MKKIIFLFFLMGTVGWVNAQVLNQNAGWPNAAWTITGSYSTLPAAFESDPTTTANFAFDDDDALNGHEDNIAAESPVIDLTPAFTAGETWLTVTVQYGYRYFANDQLRFEYWNADTSSWVAWGANIPGNSTTATDNFCTTITKTTFTTTTLSIAAFTSTQLSGFKYRISYDDDPAGTDWNYGFCFDSPTIVSSTPPSCPNPSALSAVPTSTSATLSWTENGSATLYNIEYGLNGFTQGAGTLLSGVSNSYNLSPLTSSTAYSYYVQAACGGSAGESAWVGPFNFTTLFTPPANDDCAGAIELTVNPDFACGTTTAGTTQGATLSLAATPCFGNPDDDVWFSFVATATSHRIVLSNIVAVGAGTSVDAYMQVLSGACGSQTSVLCSDPNTANPTGLTIGETYYVRVYTYGNTNNITFNICVGTPPPPPVNDECSGAISLTVNPDFNCGSVTAGTVLSATASNVDATACGGTEDDDVWFRFVATATSHRISLLNVAGSVTDMYHSVWTGSDCGSLNLVTGSCSDPNTSNPSGLTIGEIYYVRVYTFTATGGQSSTFNICIGTPPPPPSNDDCAGAISLTVNPDYACGTVTAGTTAGGTQSMAATPCFGTPNDDVWFSFVATSTSQRVSLLNVVAVGGTSTDAYMQVLSGVCGTQTSVLCSDPNTADLTGLTVGETYYVRVYTYGTANNINFNICVGTPPPPPANDECAGAITVTCGSATTGTTTLATNENMAVCGISGVTTQNTPGVWYKFIGDGSDVTVTTCSPTVTTGDSRIAVYSGSCGALTCIGGNDDAQLTGCATNALSSVVTFSSVAGTDYYILVYAYSSTALDFELNVSCVAACTPATLNDECSTATQVTIGTPIVGTDNSCSSASLGTAYPSCGNMFGTYYDTWYWFDSGSVTDATIALANQTGVSGFALYTGTCGSLTQVTGSCSTTGASLSLTGLTPATYYLRVFSVSPSERGSYDLSITDDGLGNNSFDNNNFTYYPNPVKNILSLSYNQEISNVEVYNLLGQKVSSTIINANDAHIDMSNLSKGAYMVKVTSNDQVKTIKVIKE